MTNFEKFKAMSIEEFAKTRIQWDGEFDVFTNDLTDYNACEEDKAIRDEIEWLHAEVKVCQYCNGTKVIVIYGREKTPEECLYCKVN